MSQRNLTLKELKEAVRDPKREGELHDQMLLLRERFSPSLLERLPVKDRDVAIRDAYKAMKTILVPIIGDDQPDGDPGHGRGHWARDYIHALMLSYDPELDTRVILPCLLGGTLHDIGTLFLDRYMDKNRAVRHAEAAALLVHAAALESGALTSDEADLVAYAIAAHTQYLKPSEVKCADGETRTVTPYRDTAEDGRPLLEIWMSRWVDRLDCSGPFELGRHYLTLHKDHEDLGHDGFYTVSFAEQMQPLLRTPEEIKASGKPQTMLEHMRMFASSQSNDSPYGKHDRGLMVKLRNTYRESLEHIIYQAANPSYVISDKVETAWTQFLGQWVEPTPAGKKAAESLSRAFRKLEPDVQRAWACGFRACMNEHCAWADRIRSFFVLQEVPTEYLHLPSIGQIGNAFLRDVSTEY